MEHMRLLRGMCKTGPPYSEEVPWPVRDFLTSVEAYEEPESSSDPPTVPSDTENPIALLDAFGIFPHRPPSSDAPTKQHVAYRLLRLALVAAREAYRLDTSEDEPQLLDKDAVGSLFIEVRDRYQSVCETLWDACPRRPQSIWNNPDGSSHHTSVSQSGLWFPYELPRKIQGPAAKNSLPIQAPHSFPFIWLD
ncbi:hypothetical protein DICSQDRAFT_174957 [Dichomitus squalens LYAD-421 SS1]|uniref:Uncharacterized protein n=1 Tax=Dichomitus squalens (strain LYAD-421) TaxID=732165 RepID=R7SN05_DICSQ|nr:uncharacterized protein DICSQDRAFT_174957 [Dichomitus squalens LYAD-421 SS1]EJF56382.1 hypothetical protein DICSQDRAFT_174957 [Dichomitus squalens LYAD-421 SS1]